MPRNTFRMLCAFLLGAPLGCGARTPLIDDESVGGMGAASSGGSPTGSGATAGAGGVNGGAGGIGASGGAGASGGVAGAAGLGGVAGTGAGNAGPGGSAGGGAGGAPSPGRLRQACRDLCGPYAEACPAEFGSVQECTRDCVDSLNDTPVACRELTADALDCLGAYLTTDATCEEALTKATFYCQDELLAIDSCNDVPRPDPPLDCTGTATESPESCTVNLTCSNGNYYVGCKQVDPQQSLCSCSNDSSSSTLTVYGPGGEACGEALTRCGYAF